MAAISSGVARPAVSSITATRYCISDHLLRSGAPLVGGRSHLLRTPPPRSDTASRIFFRGLSGTPVISDPTPRRFRGDCAPLPYARPVRTSSWLRSIAKPLTRSPHMPPGGWCCGPLLRLGRSGNEMVAEAGPWGLWFGLACREQDVLAALRVGPFLAQWPARALDAIDGQASEASLGDLAGQAVRGMEVGGGEELGLAGRVGVAVLAVGQVLLHDRPEDRVIEPARIQPVEQRGEPAPRHGQQPPTWPQHPPGLAQRPLAVRSAGQVIQRPEQQHRVLRPIGFCQLPRITGGSGEAGGRIAACHLACLLHVQRHRVYQVHAVPAPGQLGRVGAGAAADIQHLCGRRWQQAIQQLHRPDELQRRPPAGEQPGTLIAGAVMTLNRRINHPDRLPGASPPTPPNSALIGAEPYPNGGTGPHAAAVAVLGCCTSPPKPWAQDFELWP